MLTVKYVGLDVHDDAIAVHVLDAYGVTILKAVVPTRAADIHAALRAVRGPVTVAFEEGPLSNWLLAIVRRRAAEVIVCDARWNRFLRRGSRSDGFDAANVAELLRVRAVRGVYHGDEVSEQLRVLAHHYDALTQDLVRTKLRLRAVFRSRAIRTGGEALFNPRNRRKLLRKLTRRPAEHMRASALFRQLDFISSEQAVARAALVGEASKSPAFVLLQSFPCVGPVRAALFIAVVVSPERFANRRRFWRYAGFAVRRVGTGEHVFENGVARKLPEKSRTSGLEPRCNHVLKRVIRQTACGIVAMRRGTVRAYYDRLLTSGKSPAMARTTLARKIAATLMSVWRTSQPFDRALFAARSLHLGEASKGRFLPQA